MAHSGRPNEKIIGNSSGTQVVKRDLVRRTWKESWFQEPAISSCYITVFDHSICLLPGCKTNKTGLISGQITGWYCENAPFLGKKKLIIPKTLHTLKTCLKCWIIFVCKFRFKHEACFMPHSVFCKVFKYCAVTCGYPVAVDLCCKRWVKTVFVLTSHCVLWSRIKLLFSLPVPFLCYSTWWSSGILVVDVI